MVWQGFKPFQFFKPCSYFVSYTYIDVDKLILGPIIRQWPQTLKPFYGFNLIRGWSYYGNLIRACVIAINCVPTVGGPSLLPPESLSALRERERERVRFYQAAIKLPRPSAAATKIGNLVELSLIIVYAKYKQVGIISFTSQFLKPGKTNDAILEGY